MATCKNCGTKTSSGTTILVALIGGLFAFLVGIPLLIVILLTAVAAIGTSASGDFSNVSDQLQGADPSDYSFSNSLDHLPQDHFDPTDTQHEDNDFTAAQ